MLGWSKKCDGQGKAISGLAKASVPINVTYGGNIETIPINAVTFDTGNYFNGDGKVHIQEDGIYIITGKAYYRDVTNMLGTARVMVVLNGGAEIADGATCPNANSYGIAIDTSVVYKLNKGDYLELRTQLSGSNGTVKAYDLVPARCYISIARLGD